MRRDEVLSALAACKRVGIAGALGDGTERVVGVASADDFAIAPLSGRRCLFYEVVVERFGSGGLWSSVLRDAAGVPFDLDDGTGRARINPTGIVACAIALDHQHDRRSIDEHLERYLARHGVHRGLSSLRLIEGVIETGEQIVAAGPAIREHDPRATGAYRDGPTRLRLTGSPSHPVLLSDDRDACALT